MMKFWERGADQVRGAISARWFACAVAGAALCSGGQASGQFVSVLKPTDTVTNEYEIVTSLAIDQGQLLVGARSQRVREGGSIVSAGVVDLYELGTGQLNYRTLAPNLLFNNSSWLDRPFGYEAVFYGDQLLVGEVFPGNLDGGAVHWLDRQTGAVTNTLFASGPADSNSLSNTPGFNGIRSLGVSISIDGDIALIGATGTNARDNERGEFSGGVVLYDLANQQPLALVRNPTFSSRGTDVAGIDVALNGNQALFGIPGDSSVTPFVSNSGSIAVYDLEADSSLVIELDDEQLSRDARFGSQVAWYGSVPVVSAPADFRRSEVPGAVYIFTDDESGASGFAPLSLEDVVNEVGNRLGAAIAIDGDLLVIGAPGTDDSTGAAYVYDFVQQQVIAILSPDDLEAGDNFGSVVAIDGQTVAVGTSTQAIGDGAVYVFQVPEPGTAAIVLGLAGLIMRRRPSRR